MNNILDKYGRNAGFHGLTRAQYIDGLISVERHNMEWEQSPIKALYDSLTSEDKEDIIEINGKRYIRKIAEYRGLIDSIV